MICDHAVWFSHQRLSNKQAGALYIALCEGNTSGVQAHPAVDAFYSELVAKHPQIDEITDDQPGRVRIHAHAAQYFKIRVRTNTPHLR